MSAPWEDYAGATAVADKPTKPWEDYAGAPASKPAAANAKPWEDFQPGRPAIPTAASKLDLEQEETRWRGNQALAMSAEGYQLSPADRKAIEQGEILPATRWQVVKSKLLDAFPGLGQGYAEGAQPSAGRVLSQLPMLLPMAMPEKLAVPLFGYFTAQTAAAQPVIAERVRDEIKRGDYSAAQRDTIEDVLQLGIIGGGMMAGGGRPGINKPITEKGAGYAGTIRTDQGEPAVAGQEQAGSRADRRGHVQQTASGPQPGPVAEETSRAEPQPETGARGGAAALSPEERSLKAAGEAPPPAAEVTQPAPVETASKIGADIERQWLAGHVADELSDAQLKREWRRVGGKPNEVKAAKTRPDLLTGIRGTIRLQIELGGKSEFMSKSSLPPSARAKPVRPATAETAASEALEEAPPPSVQPKVVKVAPGATGSEMTSSSTAGDVALRTVPPIKSSRMVSEATQPQSAEPVKPENEISLAGAVGMGGALRTENLSPGGPAEQTLLDTLRNFSPKGAQSGLTTVPMAERLADTVTGTKTGLQNWWLRTRAGSEQTKRLLFGLGPEATGDYWSTKRELLKDKQVNEGTSLRVIKEGARLAPDPLVRKAMGKFAEASMFDNPDEMLGEWANGSKRATTKRQYEMARQLTPEQKKVAHQAVQFFLGKGEELKNAGLLSHLIEDYAGQHMVDFRHNESPAEMNALRADLASGKLNTNFRYALKRTFQTEYDLERAGYKLKTTDLFDKLANYVKTANNVLANRAAVKEWMNGQSADGRPLFASGLGRRLVEATDGRPNPALFVNPKVRPHPKIKDADGNDVDVSGEYVKLEHPAFKKWQWVEMDPESGRTVWVQGDVWAHKSIAGDLRNTLEGSTLYSRIPGVSTLTRVNSQAKGIKLVGLFHHVKTDTHALFHMTMPWKFYARKLDLNDPWTQQKMRWGVTYFEPNGSELFSEGLASSSVLQKLAGVTGKVGEAVTGSEAFGRAVNIGERLKNYQEFLFQHHIPLVKDAVFEDAYRRNLQRYSRNPAGARGAVTQMMRYVPVVRKFRPVLTNDQIGQRSAHQMNSAFGLVSWRLYGINPTFQHALRLGLLAPDFQAAQTGFMAQLMSRTGAEQRMAAAIMVATVYTTARILNEIFDRNPHWEAKHAFSVIYGNRAYGFRTVASDVLRAFTSTSQFVYHKLAPLPSALGEWLTGIDVLGRKETRGRAYVNMAERLVPIPLTPRSDLNFVEGAMAGTFGYYENRYSAVSDLRGKARHWMKWNKDPKLQAAAAAQTQSSYPESAYLKLDHELQDGQLPAAAKEYNALLDAGKTTKEILQRFSLTRPFITGDRATDLRFQMSFSPVDQRLYQQATALRAKQYQALLRVIPREQLRAAITPTPQRVKDFMLQRLGASEMQIAFGKLELGDAIQVWEAANDRQKVALAPFLVQKEEAKFNALSQQVRSGRLNQTVAAVQTEAIAREVRLVAPYWRRAANPGAPAAGVNGTNRSAMMRQ